MFFASNIYGSECMRRAYDTIPIESHKRALAVSKLLGVTERTLSSWLTGKSTPPRSAVIALWHESHEGRATVAGHAAEGLRLHRSHAESLQLQVAEMRATIAALHAEIDALKRSQTHDLAANENRYLRA